jgi:hypothetical protein
VNTDSQDSQYSQRNPREEVPSLTREQVVNDRPYPWCLRLDLFVAHVVEEHHRREQRRKHGDPWHTRLWHIVRMLRGWHSEGVKPEDVFRKVTPMLQDIFQNLLGRRPPSGWELFHRGNVKAEGGPLDLEVAYNEFVLTWGKVLTTPDLDPLEDAWQKAKTYPITTKRHSSDIPTPRYNQFIALAGFLQLARGDRVILLPVREVGAKMGAHKKLVSGWRQWGEQDGYLTKVKDHVFRSAGKSDATEFRFNAEMLEWFKGLMRRETK